MFKVEAISPLGSREKIAEVAELEEALEKATEQRKEFVDEVCEIRDETGELVRLLLPNWWEV